MLQNHYPRFLAIGVCLLLLFGLFVVGGAGWPTDPSAGPGIDINDAITAPQSHAGEFTETSGTVVSTNPVVIEIETNDGGTDRIELENAPRVEEGEILTVSGTLTEDGTLTVQRDRATARESWEMAYMYLISVVGVFIVVVTGVDSWRFDVRTLSVQPRERPLYETLLHGSGGDSDG